MYLRKYVLCLVTAVFTAAAANAGSGTEADPYTIAEAIGLAEGTTEYWAQGYIVGGRYNDFEEPFMNDYGVSVADSPSESDVDNCLQVKLEPDGGRETWGLNSNPSKLGTFIKFQGQRDTYGGYPSFEFVDNADISEAGASSNQPPILLSIGDQSVTVSNALTFSVVGTDAIDNDDVTLYAAGLPPGAVFHSVTNATTASNDFTWASAEPVGVYTSVFYAVDKDGTNSEQVVISVHPPVDNSGILITEVMQNPSAAADADGEWFEIFNNSSTPIDVNGWTIKDDDTDSHLIDHGGPLVIPSYGFLVLGNNADTGSNGGVQVDYEYSGLFLANGADEIVLLDGSLTERARIEYDSASEWPSLNGESMYLKSPDLDPNVGANWDASTTVWTGGDGDFGSPGEANETGDWGDPGPAGPTITITNPAADAVVAFGVTEYDLQGTASTGAVGVIAWTNSLTGGSGTIAAGTNWSAAIALDVGDNVIAVTATNATGQTGADSVTIARQTDPTLPAIAITDPAGGGASVGAFVTAYDVSGTASSGTVGQIVWTNSLTGGTGMVPAATNWTIAGLALGEGANVITVTGTNAAGVADSDTTTIERASLPANVWINEIHYDNAGIDTNEGVEVAGSAGTDLSHYEIAIYTSLGDLHSAANLSGVIDDEGCGYGALWFAIPGLLNTPSGLALVHDGSTVAHFPSYEGTVTAVEGPADGLTSSLTGVGETGATPIGFSVQLVGTGTNAAAFSWSGPTNASPGSLNDAQFIAGCGGADADGDGIDDDWENRYGGIGLFDGTSDYDHDGSPDVEEFTADTNPTNPASFFPTLITNAARNAGSVIAFTVGPPTTNSRIYDVWWTDDLVSGAWSNLHYDVPGADDGGAVLIPVTNAAPTGYYRTGVRRP